MPQKYQTGEFNSFVGGLITEASPLTFPENASIDEANFVLDDSGARRRRLGLDLETDTGVVPSISGLGSSDIISTYTWKNPGNVAGKSLVCLHYGKTLYIIDRSQDFSVGWSSQSFVLSAADIPAASFAAVDGRLVVAFDNPSVSVFEYNPSTGNITSSSIKLKVRDLFGIAATVSGVDTWTNEGISYRPDTGVANIESHIYNLRNQGWMEPRTRWFEGDGAAWAVPSGYDGAETMGDPIRDFLKPRSSANDTQTLPSNADSVTSYLYPRTNISGGQEFKEIERFDAASARSSRVGNFGVAKGGFVIDLLDRGSSRESAYLDSYDNLKYVYGRNNAAETWYSGSLSLPSDKTEGGVKQVAEYAGRVWYGGIDGELTGGDDLSPSLTSYVFYSQQVKDFSNINRCYQDGDPTSKEEPDRLDTDGGFIRLSGCSRINGMVQVGASLLVFSETGVWAISGSDSGEFNANNQSVSKVTEKGTVSPQSIALVEGTVVYWSDDGIYQVGLSELGSMQAKKISNNIDSFYQRISSESRQFTSVIYDEYESKIRWMYDRSSATGDFKELVFDVKLGAFYPNIINSTESGNIPITLAAVEIPPYNVSDSVSNVVAGADNVVAGTDNVVATTLQRSFGTREFAYLTYGSTSGQLSFSTFSNTSFKDWESYDSTGVDAAAFMVTGYISTGDSMMRKQVPYIHFHFYKTEDGFVDTGTDLEPTGQSSCLVQAQWNWANSANSGRWGREFQAYRIRRAYMPSSASDLFDNGNLTVVSKNKLRGSGKVLSLYIRTEEDKDLQLIGWGMNIGTTNRL